MTRRTSAIAALAACLLLPSGAHAADPVPVRELPRADCIKAWKDAPADDGYWNPTGIASANVQKAPGLDIERLYFRSTPDVIEIFLKIKNIPDASGWQPYELGYRYDVGFTHGKTTFATRRGIQSANGDTVIGQNGKSGSPKIKANGSTDDSNAAKTLGGSVDPAKDYVTWTIPRSEIQRMSGDTPVEDGEVFTKIWAKTYSRGPQESNDTIADDLTPADAAAVWTVGDDYCFGPPPASLTDVVLPPAQFGDVSTLSAKLLSEKGAPVVGADVTFTIADAKAPLTGKTDAAGVVTIPYTVDVPAGAHAVTVTFAGTETDGKAKATGTLTTAIENTLFTPLLVKKTSTTARSITATLKDDDGKPVAGQKVSFYANGKLLSSATTTSSGVAVFKATAGQTVQAKYAGLAGKYMAAKSNSPKV